MIKGWFFFVFLECLVNFCYGFGICEFFSFSLFVEVILDNCFFVDCINNFQVDEFVIEVFNFE